MTQGTIIGNEFGIDLYEKDPQIFGQQEQAIDDLIATLDETQLVQEPAPDFSKDAAAYSQYVTERLRSVTETGDFAALASTILDPAVIDELHNNFRNHDGPPLMSSQIGHEIGQSMMGLSETCPDHYVEAIGAWAVSWRGFMRESTIEMPIKKLFTGGTYGAARSELKKSFLVQAAERTPRMEAAHHITSVIRTARHIEI